MLPGGKPAHLIVNKYYEVTDIVLGRGGFSTVYLAYHMTFRNKVALKVINRKDIKEEYVSRNLQREARILMKLNHPNIVNFYEELSQNELYCLSLEYVKGVNLNQYLKKQDAFRVSEKTAKTLFYQMVSAVSHMHQNSVLHRDLKQENILLEHGRVIKIVDFGLSNKYETNSSPRTHCGSLIYAAPELFQNRSVYGAGVDLWSLGVILYAMVIGRMPFELAKNEGGTSSTNLRRKELFFKRISQGLTRENWEDMRMLSIDCCNLLKNLLQPDQFKRISVKMAILHSWFHKDGDLRRRLPQHRADMRQKFSLDIIDYMSDKMKVSRDRIRTHLKSYRYETISAIFCILQDTLMKEALYPPRSVESTFLYKFETWKKDFEAKKRDEREKKTRKSLSAHVYVESKYLHPPKNDKLVNYVRKSLSHDVGESKEHSFITKNRYSTDGFKRILTNDNQNSKLNRIWAPDYSRSKIKDKFNLLKDSVFEMKNTPLLNSFDEDRSHYFTKKSYPFKSYKNNRPNKQTAKDNQTERGSQDEESFVDKSRKSIQEYLSSNEKLEVENKKSSGQHRITNRQHENKNKVETKKGPFEIITRKTLTAIGDHRYPQQAPCLLASKVSRVLTAKQSDSKTKIMKQHSLKPRVSPSPRPSLPVQSESYIERNIIVNQADRDGAKMSYNSNIPVRSSKSSLTPKMEDKSKDQKTIPHRPRMYSTSTNSKKT